MQKLIINADDMGLNERVNDGIMEALRLGLVTSTSLMACGRAFDHAVLCLKKNDIHAVGVHLVLDEERPLLCGRAVPTLVCENGQFLNRNELLKRLLLTRRINLEEVKQEFRAQIQKCLVAGFQITHLDGHGHVHVYPFINRVVVQLAQEFGIGRARIPAESLFFMDIQNFNLKKYINKMIVTSFALLAKRHFAAGGIRFPSAFMGMLFGGNLDITNLSKVFSRMPSAEYVEIMSHPGLQNSALETDYAHWNYHWKNELSALLSKSKAETEKQYGIKLISFTEL